MKFSYHPEGTIPKDKNMVWVFGSNLAGLHGKGAAKVAAMYFGAKHGRGIGISGTSYAIPTKDADIVTLPLDTISTYIDRFVKFTNQMMHTAPQVKFFVTSIGTGLAGYRDVDIAPLFKHAATNCSFPEQWRPFLEI